MDKSQLRREVAQLIIIRASGYNLDSQRLHPNLELSNYKLKRLLEAGVGGVIFFGGTLKELEIRCKVLTKWAGKPLLLCADVEEGVGQRFQGGTKFVPPMGIAQIYKRDQNLAISIAEQMGIITGQEAKKIGLNWVLAPVCDINNNPNNPVINLRAWGEDPSTVSALSCAFHRGLSSTNVLSCAKHFPGHGNSSVDSHLELPIIENDLSTLENFELIPFRSLIDQDISSLMIGHLLFTNIDPNQPATLSRKLVTDLLRRKLKFDGLVVTDALVMNAISEKYSGGEAAVRAFEAGIDLIMMPEDADEAIDSLVESINTGRLSTERLYQSIERKNKILSKLSNELKPENIDIMDQINEEKILVETSNFVKNVVQESVLIIEDKIEIIGPNDVNLLQIDDFEQVSNKSTPALLLPEEAGYRNVIAHPLGISPWDDSMKNTLSLNKIGKGKILFQLFTRGKPFLGNNYKKDSWFFAINKLAKEKKLSGLVIYGCPYLFDRLRKSLSSSIPLAYSPSQLEEAQNYILSRMLEKHINSFTLNTKFNIEFTD